MKQITEDYVSYEIAKLLKEKGFNEEVRTFYNSNGKFEYCSFPLNHNLDIGSGFTSASSQSLALKWLREVHNLHITIKPYITEEGIMYLFEIYKLEAEKFTLIKTKTGFEKSEQANEAACLYILKNLI